MWRTDRDAAVLWHVLQNHWPFLMQSGAQSVQLSVSDNKNYTFFSQISVLFPLIWSGLFSFCFFKIQSWTGLGHLATKPQSEAGWRSLKYFSQLASKCSSQMLSGMEEETGRWGLNWRTTGQHCSTLEGEMKRGKWQKQKKKSLIYFIQWILKTLKRAAWLRSLLDLFCTISLSHSPLSSVLPLSRLAVHTFFTSHIRAMFAPSDMCLYN